MKVTIKENLKALDDLARKARDLQGQRNIPLPDLLSPDFLSRCSHFRSAEELLNASGFQIESPEDFEAIPEDDWDAFIQRNTSYPTWDEMLTAATGEWLKAHLGF